MSQSSVKWIWQYRLTAAVYHSLLSVSRRPNVWTSELHCLVTGSWPQSPSTTNQSLISAQKNLGPNPPKCPPLPPLPPGLGLRGSNAGSGLGSIPGPIRSILGWGRVGGLGPSLPGTPGRLPEDREKTHLKITDKVFKSIKPNQHKHTLSAYSVILVQITVTSATYVLFIKH